MAKIDQLAATPEGVFQIAYYGDIYVAVNDDGTVELMDRPEEPDAAHQ